MTIYAVTIKLNHKGPTEEEYQELLYKLYNNEALFLKEMVYETDLKNNLHIHGIINYDRKFSYKQLVKKYKCHIFFREISNVMEMDHWMKYMKKQKYKQNSILTLNPFYHQYMFVN